VPITASGPQRFRRCCHCSIVSITGTITGKKFGEFTALGSNRETAVTPNEPR